MGGNQDRSIATGVSLEAYLQVYKDLTATTHTDGLFDLLVDNVVKTVAPVGDGGFTPKLLLDFGNSTAAKIFAVSEAGSTTTDPDTLLSWYFKNVKCYDRLAWPYFPAGGATTYAATTALTNDSDLNVSITPGQDIYCIITNADYPTAVTLASSSANEFLGLVTLNWATGFEDISTVGFDVFRSDVQDGPQSKVNADLILAKGSGEAYQFFDASVLPGKTYYYFVQLVDGSGSSNLDVLSVDTMHYLKMPLLFK